ncbi:MAG: phage holin family protein [Bacteroidota bacterium]|nr:phage holin family protein [Bacteroidota bacterium]
MENKPSAIEELFSRLKEYADTRITLYKLQAINKVSGFTSTVITMLILLMILFTVILCLSIGAALAIGNLLGSAASGFFIIAGVYLIVGLVLFSIRGSLLKTPVSNKLIKEMVD